MERIGQVKGRKNSSVVTMYSMNEQFAEVKKLPHNQLAAMEKYKPCAIMNNMHSCSLENDIAAKEELP